MPNKQTKTARKKREVTTPGGFPVHKIDLRVGANIKHFRQLAGMTQRELSKSVGVRFQQIEKYESAKNRVAASRLWTISEALDIDIGEFFK